MPHGNGVLHSPIQFDPTIPQFQPLYSTASFAEFRSAVWSYLDGFCADHCGVHVVADYECADRGFRLVHRGPRRLHEPGNTGDTITVVLTDATPTDSSSAPDSPVSSAPNGE